MSPLYVISEAAGEKYRSSTYELLSVARKLAAETNDEVVAVTVGDDAAGKESLDGLANKVLSLTGENLSPYAPEPWTEVIASVLSEAKPALVLFGEGPRTRELIGRLAVKLEASQPIMNAVALTLEGEKFLVNRPVMGGKAYGTYVCEGTCLAAFRPNSFPTATPAVSTTFEEVAVSPAPARAEVVGREEEEQKRLDITEALAVVGGGRGMKVPENLKLLEDLAEVLKGAVGVTRALVDAGWATHAIQIGKSGKTISPGLYFSCGISGAVHHIMGMDTSKVVVTINTDRTAPMFEYSDYGVVGDALEILPAVTAEVKKVKS